MLEYLVSMGIYALEPSAIDFVRPGVKCDFPDLVRRLLHEDQRVQAFIHKGYWLDIGRPQDYETANEYVEEHPETFSNGGTTRDSRWNSRAPDRSDKREGGDDQ